MAKEMEIFDTWIQSQKEMMDTWVRVQGDFFNTMADSARKMQEAMLWPGRAQGAEGARAETMNWYNQMVETMLSSSKVLADQTLKLQGAWQEALKRQMDMTSGMARNFMELGRQAMQQAQGHEGHHAHESEAA